MLLKCLKEQEEIKKLCSVKYESRIPMKGMEQEFYEQEQVCKVLREMVQALENEQVRKVLADWQKDVMEQGPTALTLDSGNEMELRFDEG